MKCLVLLAGCGLGDGSCIEEVILTYAALDRYGCDYTPVAEDISVPSVNHLTEQLADNRNVLLESARIGRGRIKILDEEEKMDALKKLMDHYHMGKDAYFNPAAISRTLVYVLEVEKMTGKRKKPK